MPTSKRAWNEKVYHMLLAEGRGRGEFDGYLPWITVMDFASRGRSTRVEGIKSGRTHHFLSWNETAFFYLLDSSSRVIDIREQYALLRLEETLRIAEKAGIRHPRDSKSHFPYVLTTDFYIITTEGAMARSIKEKKELDKPRVREKLELERRYWLERGIDWKVVTEDQIDYRKAENIRWIRRGRLLESLVPDPEERRMATEYFLQVYENTTLPISIIAAMVEEAFGYSSGTGIVVFQFLALSQQVKIDLSEKVCTVSKRI